MATSTSDAPSAVLGAALHRRQADEDHAGEADGQAHQLDPAGARRRRIDATSAENSGSAPFSIPVTPRRSTARRSGTSSSGTPSRSARRAAMRGQSLPVDQHPAGGGEAAEGGEPEDDPQQRDQCPARGTRGPRRSGGTTTPRSGRRRGGAPQSTGVNAAALVPSAVEISRCRAAGAPTAAPSATGEVGDVERLTRHRLPRRRPSPPRVRTRTSTDPGRIRTSALPPRRRAVRRAVVRRGRWWPCRGRPRPRRRSARRARRRARARRWRPRPGRPGMNSRSGSTPSVVSSPPRWLTPSCIDLDDLHRERARARRRRPRTPACRRCATTRQVLPV